MSLKAIIVYSTVRTSGASINALVTNASRGFPGSLLSPWGFKVKVVNTLPIESVNIRSGCEHVSGALTCVLTSLVKISEDSAP